VACTADDYKLFKEQLNMKHTHNGEIKSFLNITIDYDVSIGRITIIQKQFIEESLCLFNLDI
jgi:hypothetical protein